MALDDLALHEDFRDLLICLLDADADFLLIGGWALALHGHARGTDDIDVLVRATPENAERVYQALVAFGAPVAAHGVTAGLFAHSDYGYRIGVKPFLIELLTKIDGMDFDEAIEGAESFRVDDAHVARFMGRNSLLKNKRASGRPKDLADVAWLESHPNVTRRG